MRTFTKTLVATAALTAAIAPSASANTVVADAPGARALAGAGGWLAWSDPTPDGRWQLTLRSPTGTLSRPVAASGAPIVAALGTNAQYGASRRLVVVYTRAGDVYELDAEAGTEKKLSRLAPHHDARLAAVNLGQYVVVRKTGMYAVSRSGNSRRLTRTVPSQIAMAQSRAASIEHGKVVIRRLSGRGRPMVAGKNLSSASSPWLTRYRAGWATSSTKAGTQLYATRRFAGSGGPFTLTVVRDAFTSRSPLFGIVTDRGEPGFYLDDQGVKRFDPTPFHGR